MVSQYSFPWEVPLLDRLIKMIFSDKDKVELDDLRKMYDLFKYHVDIRSYDVKSIKDRVEFIYRSLEAKLNKGIEDVDLILICCEGDKPEDQIDVKGIYNSAKNNGHELNQKEIDFLNDYISDRLQYGFCIKYADAMKDIIVKIEAKAYLSYKAVTEAMVDWCNRFKQTMRKIERKSSSTAMFMDAVNLREQVDDILLSLDNSENAIPTGYKLLDKMLKGGLRRGRLTVALGITGGYKSALLLDLSINACKYLSKVKNCRKTKKKPLIVYLSMENSKEETFERMYRLATGEEIRPGAQSEDLIKTLKDNKIVEGDVTLAILYKPSMSVTTQYISDLIDEYNSSGYEVMMMAFDFIKKIHSVGKYANEKEELKNVTNELKDIASEYNIPFLTAHQLNRETLRSVSIAKRSGDFNDTTMIGLEHIGSAFEVAENADVAFAINIVDDDRFPTKYLTFTGLKSRYGFDIRFFHQPFVSRTSFNLVKDIDDDAPQGVYSIKGEKLDYANQVRQQFDTTGIEQTANSSEAAIVGVKEQITKKVSKNSKTKSTEKGVSKRMQKIYDKMDSIPKSDVADSVEGLIKALDDADPNKDDDIFEEEAMS